MAVRILTPPIVEPVTLNEVLEFLRLDVEDEGVAPLSLSGLITTAREVAESRTSRAVITQTLELVLDAFPGSACTIQIPRPPLQTVEEVKYMADGSETVLDSSSYIVDTASEPGRIAPTPGRSWPVADAVPGAVRIRYVAGYPVGEVPSGIQTAMLMLIGGWWDHPEGVSHREMRELPFAASALLDQHRVYGVRE